ncbi:MAG: PmoA family protein [Candidatus Hydrogenedentes bacterium]|nr:PmoA family protein [Candidatus Hydrogenedentota bacterium]
MKWNQHPGGILAALLSAAALGMTCNAFAQPAQEGLTVQEEGDSVWIRHDGRTLLRYRFGEVPFKPYVQEWFSPKGVNILRDAPADHKHHHALMFAISVDGVNFWEEKDAPGTQAHRGLSAVHTGRTGDVAYASLTEQLDWIAPPTGAVLLHETRTIRVYDTPPPEAALLTWESRFEVPAGKEKAVLGGSHYFGLGMRFVESMDTVGEFAVPQGALGEIVRGDEHLTAAPWCAYTAPAGGHSVTVALFGDPGNVRHPPLWFTMKEHFAYIAATLNLWREPLEVASGTPLVLRYGAALWDGTTDAQRIESTYRRWLELSAPPKQ